MIWNPRLIIVLLTLTSTLSCASQDSTQSRSVYQEKDQKVCTEKPPSYTSDFEARLKADLPLAGKTPVEAEAIIKSYLSKEPLGSGRGEDLQGYLFYICQIANNGHWSEEATLHAINLFLEKWPSNKKQQAQLHPQCMQKLESGYALKGQIDREYWEARKAGVFKEQTQTEALINRWVNEAAHWERDTGALLVQIAGPSARGRFMNGEVSATVIAGNAKWNQVRNVIQARLAALEVICRDIPSYPRS